jgi:hypothetical protein
LKIIFLDVDGVLNSDNSKSRLPLSKKLLKNLREIVKETGAKIVVSSTWRRDEFAMKKLRRALEYKKMKIYSSTTIHYFMPRQIRGDEIDLWLKSHSEIDSYVILDDCSDFHDHHMQNFVQTDCRVGLTESDVKRAINILNKENKMFREIMRD